MNDVFIAIPEREDCVSKWDDIRKRDSLHVTELIPWEQALRTREN